MNNLEDNDTLTQRIIGCAIEVHRTLGPGLLESAYEQCMAHEMTVQDIAFRLQVPTIETGYDFDEPRGGALRHESTSSRNRCRNMALNCLTTPSAASRRLRSSVVSWSTLTVLAAVDSRSLWASPVFNLSSMKKRRLSMRSRALAAGSTPAACSAPM